MNEFTNPNTVNILGSNLYADTITAGTINSPGFVGATGPQGSPGPNGAPGGFTGATGSQGFQGPTGAAGSALGVGISTNFSASLNNIASTISQANSAINSTFTGTPITNRGIIYSTTGFTLPIGNYLISYSYVITLASGAIGSYKAYIEDATTATVPTSLCEFDNSTGFLTTATLNKTFSLAVPISQTFTFPTIEINSGANNTWNGTSGSISINSLS